MRAIGAIPDEESARRFAEYLFARGIMAELRPSADRGFVVWVRHDDHVAQARVDLDDFLRDPGQDKYHQASELAEALRVEEARRQQEYLKNVRHVTNRSLAFGARSAVVTPLLIALAVGIYALGWLARDVPVREYLFINGAPQNAESARRDILPSVRGGEVWRLWTPALLHFTPFHLLFNIMGMYNLGMAIEYRLRIPRMIALIVVLGVVPNLSQYFWSGSQFGGLSGIVCGLFGYVWMKSSYDPSAMMFLDQRSVLYFLAFLIIAAIGGFGPVANVAHFVGLGVGMAVGVYNPLLAKKRSRP